VCVCVCVCVCVMVTVHDRTVNGRGLAVRVAGHDRKV
jgi:hypothetical protein